MSCEARGCDVGGGNINQSKLDETLSRINVLPIFPQTILDLDSKNPQKIKGLRLWRVAYDLLKVFDEKSSLYLCFSRLVIPPSRGVETNRELFGDINNVLCMVLYPMEEIIEGFSDGELIDLREGISSLKVGIRVWDEAIANKRIRDEYIEFFEGFTS